VRCGSVVPRVVGGFLVPRWFRGGSEGCFEPVCREEKGWGDGWFLWLSKGLGGSGSWGRLRVILGSLRSGPKAHVVEGLGFRV
jgi:hypothetical protein